MSSVHAPGVLLLVSTHCSHCHALEILLRERLVKMRISDLEVINIDQSPEVAQQHDVRSVPWMKLGDYVFNESLTPGGLDHWLDLIAANTARTPYLEYLLLNGKLSMAIEWIEGGKALLKDLLPLLSKPDVKINVRIGIGAIMENFENTDAIRLVIPVLGNLIKDEDPMVRIDACHYLVLAHSGEVAGLIEGLLSDRDPQVRQAAGECLDELDEDI